MCVCVCVCVCLYVCKMHAIVQIWRQFLRVSCVIVCGDLFWTLGCKPFLLLNSVFGVLPLATCGVSVRSRNVSVCESLDLSRRARGCFSVLLSLTFICFGFENCKQWP